MSSKASHSLPASVTISSHPESSFECVLREAPLWLLFSNIVTCVGVRRLWGGGEETVGRAVLQVEVRGHHEGVTVLLPSGGSWGLNSGCHA